MERSPHKQIIIVRKDLNMSPGKLAAQVSHGSMAFLTTAIRKSTYKVLHSEHKEHFYVSELHIPADNYEILWVCAGGEIVYLEGNVTIHYVTSNPRIEVKSKRIVHGDTVHLYVPKGSIEIMVTQSL